MKRQRRTSDGKFAVKHGMRNTSTYSSWIAMRHRCELPRHPRYRWYGGRGIKICSRWLDFANFLADMGERPEGNYTLSRIDNDGDYEPSNCCWDTMTNQLKEEWIRIRKKGD